MPRFLNLPASVRHRIYYSSGLMIGTEVHLGQVERAHLPAFGDADQQRQQAAQRALDVKSCRNGTPEYSSSLSLMLTCRTINLEVTHLLLSTNHFHACDLESLRKLSVSSFASMKSLTFTLNSSQIEAYCGNSDLGNTGKARPLDASISQDRELLSDWEKTAHLMGPQIRPHSLNFRFICDVADQQTADMALCPLLRYFPVLLNCDLRLSTQRDELLQRKAISAAQRACAQQREPNMPFRFLELPTELQLKVLRFTELVTPLNSVKWDEFKKYSLHINVCTEPCGPPYDSCHPHHAFTEAARSIFFALNDFVVDIGSYDSPSSPHLDIFLTTKVPRHSLKHIRSLRLNMMGFIREEQREEWLSTTLRIRPQLEGLQHLRIDLGCCFGSLPSWPDYPYPQMLPRPTFAEETGIDIVKGTVNLFWSLENIGSDRNLPGLKTFLIWVDFGGPGISYYARRSDAILPGKDIDIANIHPVEAYVDRPLPSSQQSSEREQVDRADVSCAATGDTDLPSVTDPDNKEYQLGQCSCNIPIIKWVGDNFVASLPALCPVTCTVWKEAAKDAASLLTGASGVDTAETDIQALIKVVKMLGKQGKSANDFEQYVEKHVEPGNACDFNRKQMFEDANKVADDAVADV
ncbi:hypothetical protein SCUP234_08160 [Seiridium cupressi]